MGTTLSACAAVLALGQACLDAAQPEADTSLLMLIRGYSTQKIIRLNVGEAFTFRLRAGGERVLRLVSVQEHRDSVIGLVRRADVRVEIDGRPLDLVCAPYVMPTESAGLRIMADTTTAWLPKLPKRVQFSLWDADEPIVDTTRFGFPLRNYRLLSHGTQAYNEPVHLGARDGDPTGQRFYHNYGFDLAGYEGADEVVSAIEGQVVKLTPTPEGVWVRDSQGFTCAYRHLAAVEPGLAVGTRIRRGQKLGLLGRAGGSGNFSHLHIDPGPLSNTLNLYPWLVTAYRARRPKGLFAVARPHHLVRVGEKELLDGSNSLAFGGRIVEWRWVFHDGQTVRQVRAEKAFDRPGAYVAALWVKNDKGAVDVDFCQVKVFSKADPESAMPHIFMTSTPTEGIRPGQPVRFRFWFQGRGDGPIQVDFGDGTRSGDYRSYKEVSHSFARPGIHVVTAHREVGGKPITAKLKVVVDMPGPR